MVLLVIYIIKIAIPPVLYIISICQESICSIWHCGLRNVQLFHQTKNSYDNKMSEEEFGPKRERKCQNQPRLTIIDIWSSWLRDSKVDNIWNFNENLYHSGIAINKG